MSKPNAIGYAKFRSRSHDAVIRVYDERGNVIETHEHTGDIQGGLRCTCAQFKWEGRCANVRSYDFI